MLTTTELDMIATLLRDKITELDTMIYNGFCDNKYIGIAKEQFLELLHKIENMEVI